MKRRILAALLLVLAACPVWAQLETVIADDGTERIILKHATNEYFQRNYVNTLLRGPDDSVGPLMETAPCATLGSQMIEKARSTQLNLETFVARYNLVNLWLGNLCYGKSDVLPNPAEAKGWLLGIANSSLPGNADRSLHTHEMLVQLYLFGAPGSPSDYPAALALLNEEVRAKAYFPSLYLSYVYEQGLGVPKDQNQVRSWLQRAAEAGNVDAKMLLAQAKELKNDTEAFSSYLELSKVANPPVWFRLGLMYLEGRGTQKDPCKSQEMFQKAASHYWSPVPQARKYLDQIREQNLCPQAVLNRSEPAGTQSIGLNSSQPVPCEVKLPPDPGELHPKRLDRSQKVIRDPAEYKAYIAALSVPDSEQKAAAMEEFVTRYPQSIVKADAMEQAMAAYQASGNTAKVGDTATRLLQMQPDNLRTLSIIVFIARNCAARGAFVYTKDVGKGLLQLGQRGLDALPEWQQAGGAQPEAGKLHDQLAAIFAEAAGWGALENEYYSTARFFYEKAVALNPRNLLYLRQLAVADLNMSPIDLNGFWYCGKAASIDHLQNKSAPAPLAFFCRDMFFKHGGKLEDWNLIVSNTEKDTAPPPDFAKSLSLRESSQPLLHPNPPSGNAPPLLPSEKADPISMLIPPPASSHVGAGIGSGAAGEMVPAKPPGHLPEVVSLSNNSLSNSGFGSHYGWYVQNISHKVAFNWHAPTDPDPAGHRCTIAFVILPEGTPSNIRVEKSSGFAALDESAMWAVQRVDSFGPVPTHEKIAIEFWFDSRSKE